MKYPQYRILSLFIIISIATFGCAEVGTMGDGIGAVPTVARPVESFDVKFTSLDDTKYPPTSLKNWLPYRTIVHWPGAEDEIRVNAEIKQPYKVIGKLELAQGWYSAKDVHEIGEKYIPEHGGDAVLSLELFQTKAGYFQDSNTKEWVNYYYYKKVEMTVIRFTDK
jgi:hypothetical protein